ncbi:hypothetical protein WJX77_001614 [Trebouxia sp. C0004]
MRRTPPKGPLRIQCLPRSPRLRLATGLGVLILCVLTWLILNKGNPAPEQPRSAEGVVREPGFWNAAKYGASASLQPLLLEDQRLNAAVTLGVQGHEVPLSVALDRTTPVLPIEILGNQTRHPSGAGLLILVAVTSTCCTMQAQHRRNAIRQSWALTMAKSPSPVDLKFVLAQPNDSKIADVRSLLQAEMRHQDILFVRNEELYINLPKKTINIMRYASLASPRYSHVLKTDDDCYVRVAKLVHLVQKLERDGQGMLYIGRQENSHGFFPIRDPASKWYIPYRDMPDDVVPWKAVYLAGWGYLLSQDAVQLVVSRVELYEQQPDKAPGWFAGLHWEDVLVGLLLHEYAQPQNRPDEFRAAWDSCNAGAVVKHMDVEALEVFPMLYTQENGGAWDVQTVKCQVGGYSPGDYWSWKHWRDTLEDVLRV